MLTAAQLTALATEINTDPNAYGYASHKAAGEDGVLASMLNAIRDGVTAPPAGATGAAITVARTDILPQEVIEAIDIKDFLAAPSGVNNVTWSGSWFESLMQLKTVRLRNVDLTNTQAMKNVKAMLANLSASETRLLAVAVRNGSRAEALFGFGVRLDATDIAQAFGRG